MNNAEKYAKLKTLREEDPVLWAVVRGATMPASIAKSLMWTPKDVIADLEDHPDLVASQGVWQINGDSDDSELLLELQEFSQILFRKILAWEKENRPEGKAGLTDKQAQLVAKLAELNPEGFTTLEAAKIQGFNKAGFTANQLESLVRKGQLKAIENTRPKLWKLI